MTTAEAPFPLSLVARPRRWVPVSWVLAFSALPALSVEPRVAGSEAEEPVEFRPEDPCTSGSAIGSITCMSASWERAEAALNTEYQAALRRLNATASPSVQQKFVESQRQWVRYRDAHCTFEAAAQVEGNSWNSFYRASCKAEQAEIRTQYIHKVGVD